LVLQLIVIAALSLLAVVVGGRWAEQMVLEHESDRKSARTIEFLSNHLSDLPGILASGSPTEQDLVVFRYASLAGEAFRYKLYDHQGRVVVASHPEDVGKRNRAPYFASVLREGRGLFQIDRRSPGSAYSDALGVPYEEHTRVVGKRYVPILRDSRVLGVIEVYLDMTDLEERLHANSRRFLVGLLVLLALVGTACGVSVYRNLVQRRRAMEELAEAGGRAERLADQAKSMLDNLLAAEEEKMSRVVGLVDGIAHQIGNPLATLSMGLEALEASLLAADREGCERRIADMQGALDRVGAFLHRLSAVSVEEGKLASEVDVNQIIRSLAGLVQLNDRTRSAAFAMNLSSDLAPVTLSRRSLSLSLFIVLTAAAESMQDVLGHVRVETRMTEGGERVEVLVVTSSPAATDSPAAAAAPSSPAWELSAMDTARRLVESMGGRVTVSNRGSGEVAYRLSLPLRGVPRPAEGASATARRSRAKRSGQTAVPSAKTPS
jgi:signal transduction histidine kinase